MLPFDTNKWVKPTIAGKKSPVRFSESAGKSICSFKEKKVLPEFSKQPFPFHGQLFICNNCLSERCPISKNLIPVY